MLLTTRAKEAIKIALATALAYAIALSMDWDNPKWAAFAVAMASLPSVGQSLRKGADRMLGTLVAGAVALLLIGLFPQDRWLFMIGLSVWVGMATYLMLGSRNAYFWQVGAFVCAIIVFSGGANSLNAFDVTMVRVQETGLGFLVYTLVSVFLWPQSARAALDASAPKLASIQAQLFRAYTGTMQGHGEQADGHDVRMQEVQALSQFQKALAGAEADSYEVWEARRLWRRVERTSVDFAEALERWRETFAEVRQLDMASLVPNTGSVCSEIEDRLEQIGRMLAGNAPGRAPDPAGLELDAPETGGLSHFERAAVTATRAQLNRLEHLSRTMFSCIADIKGYGPQISASLPEERKGGSISIDPEKLIGVVRVLVGMWLAFFIWVYVDPPGHQIFVALAVVFGLAFVLMPQLPVEKTWGPVLFSLGIGGVLYVFLMPRLSGYLQLGTMLFAVAFMLTYVFHEPRQGLYKAFGLGLTALVFAVDNHQTYSFAGYANTVVMVVLCFALLTVTAYIPTSPNPEKVFLRLLERFFRQSEVVLSRLSLDWKHERGLKRYAETVLYAHDLLELPQKLETWGRSIDHKLFPGNSPEQVQALVNGLQAMAFRIKELVEAREQPHADFFVRELLDEVREWRIVVQSYFMGWAKDPSMQPDDDPVALLGRRIERVERRLGEAFELADARTLSRADYDNFYRLLGAFRGLTEAMVEHCKVAGRMDWAQWREARF